MSENTEVTHAVTLYPTARPYLFNGSCSACKWRAFNSTPELIARHIHGPEITPATTIDDLRKRHGLPARAWCCLKNAHLSGYEIETIGDLVTMTARDVLRIKNLGPATLMDIQDILTSAGLQLTPTRVDGARGG